MSKFILSGFADEAAADLKTQMDVMEQLGIGYIEMRNVNGKSIIQHSLEEVKEIKKQLDDRNLKISAIGSFIGKQKITDDFIPHLDIFQHTLEVAHTLNTKYIRMFSFFLPKDEDPFKYREEVMFRWSEFIRVAKGSGLVLLHENEKDIYGETAERCLDLLQNMNCPYMKAIFDPANFVQADEETYPKAYEMLKDYLIYMHIKDAVYCNHHVVPSGHGDGKVPEILHSLWQKGYEGFLSIEPHLGNFAGFATLEPNAKVDAMLEGGPKAFAVATEALRKILRDIEN